MYKQNFKLNKSDWAQDKKIIDLQFDNTIWIEPEKDYVIAV